MSRASNLLLRLAIVFSLLYVAYGFWKHPADWVGYIPAFLHGFGLSNNVLIFALLAVHLVLALWILSGWRIFIPSILAALFLGSVVYFNLSQLDVLFRDISLALAALALAHANFSRR